MMRSSKKVENIKLHARRVVAITALWLVLHSAMLEAQSAKILFKKTCESCHGQNGSPTAVGKSVNAPELGSQVVQSHTDAQLQQIVSDGKGNMPPFSGSLSETQIRSLVAYIRTLPKQSSQAK